MKDRLGRTVKPGQLVAYAKREGNCAVLRMAHVQQVDERKGAQVVLTDSEQQGWWPESDRPRWWRNGENMVVVIEEPE